SRSRGGNRRFGKGSRQSAGGCGDNFRGRDNRGGSRRGGGRGHGKYPSGTGGGCPRGRGSGRREGGGLRSGQDRRAHPGGGFSRLGQEMGYPLRAETEAVGAAG